jgi:hypothetical protein
MGILPEAASESLPPFTPQRDWRQLKGIDVMSLNSAFENADSQSST